MSEQWDAATLVEIILDWDLTHAEIEKICSQFLGLQGETLEFVLGRSQDSWQHRVEDLVAWADRQGRLSELTGGVLYYGSVKRAARQWLMANGGTVSTSDLSNEQGNTLLRLEIKVDRLHEDVTEVKRRVGLMEANRQQSPAIDRVMVALMALAMFGMLVFNLVTMR